MNKFLLMLVMSVSSLAVWADDFDDLEAILGVEADVKITLGPGMLGLASVLTKDEPEAQAVLSGLKDLSIKVYRLDEAVDVDDISDWMADTVRKLAKNGVEEIVRVTEDDERVHIMARVNGTTLSDLSIMVYEAGDEFVFINMDGDIDVANLKDLTGNFDVDLNGLALNL